MADSTCTTRHWGEHSDKVSKHLPSGLGGDAITRTCLQAGGQTKRRTDRQTDGRWRDPSQKSSYGLRPEELMTRVPNDWKWSVCRSTCMASFSRGALCLPLNDQENIICTLPSHIATRGAICEWWFAKSSWWYRAPVASYMRRQCTHRARVVARTRVVALCEWSSMRLYKAVLSYM